MKPRKRFHCGNSECDICNTKLEAHKAKIENWKKFQKTWDSKIKQLSIEKPTLWERMKNVWTF